MTDDPQTSVDTDDHLFADAHASGAGPVTNGGAATSADSVPADDAQASPDELEVDGAGGAEDAARDGAGDDDADVAPDGDDPADGADQGEPDTEDEPIDWEARAAADGRSRAELLEALATAEVERNDWLDQLRRKQAEFDNFRKRMARDAQRQRVVGQESVARSLLDVLDDFERTVAALETDEAARKGVELVRDKLLLALQGQGMVAMDAAGTPFDPNLHEAVQQVPGDGDAATVAEVLRAGWMMHDRVLRPAMVVVAQ